MKVQENPIRDVLRLVMWYPLRWLIGWLSVTQAVKLLGCMGDIHYYCSRGKRRQLKKNILTFAPGFPDMDFAVQAYFRNHYIDQLLILIFPKMKVADIKRLVEIEGLHNLQECHERGCGVILVHGHFGPVHLPLVVLSFLGFSMKQLGNPSDSGLSWVGKHVAFRLRMHYEAMMPVESSRVRKFLRPIFTALSNNEVIMTTGDGSGTESEFGPQHDFFFLGQVHHIPLGPAILAEKTGAALLPLFVLPGREKMFQIVIGKEIMTCEGTEDRPVILMQDFLNQYEKHILHYPGYMHFLDRLVA